MQHCTVLILDVLQSIQSQVRQAIFNNVRKTSGASKIPVICSFQAVLTILLSLLVNLQPRQAIMLEKPLGPCKVLVIGSFQAVPTIFLSLLVNLEPRSAGNNVRKISGASKVPVIGCFIYSWNFIRNTNVYK